MGLKQMSKRIKAKNKPARLAKRRRRKMMSKIDRARQARMNRLRKSGRVHKDSIFAMFDD